MPQLCNKRKKLGPLPYAICSHQFQVDVDLNIKVQTDKLLEEIQCLHDRTGGHKNWQIVSSGQFSQVFLTKTQTSISYVASLQTETGGEEAIMGDRHSRKLALLFCLSQLPEAMCSPTLPL